MDLHEAGRPGQRHQSQADDGTEAQLRSERYRQDAPRPHEARPQPDGGRRHEEDEEAKGPSHRGKRSGPKHPEGDRPGDAERPHPLPRLHEGVARQGQAGRQAYHIHRLPLQHLQRHRPLFPKEEDPSSGHRPDDIETFYQDQMQTKNPNTVIRYHANIRKALQYAFKKGFILTDPADRAERPKKGPTPIASTGRRRRRFF